MSLRFAAVFTMCLILSAFRGLVRTADDARGLGYAVLHVLLDEPFWR